MIGKPRGVSSPTPPNSARTTSTPTTSDSDAVTTTAPGAATPAKTRSSSAQRDAAFRAQVPNAVLGGPGAELAPATKTGPLPLTSTEAKEAIAKAAATVSRSNNSISDAATETLDARSVERDELGMLHVRFVRNVDGVRVLNEEVISHLDASGNVISQTGEQSSVPSGMQNGFALSSGDALAKAKDAFGLRAERTPEIEKVIARDDAGKYRSAYRIELFNIFGSEKPQRMNYLVDASSGEIFGKWNEIKDDTHTSGNANTGVVGPRGGARPVPNTNTLATGATAVTDPAPAPAEDPADPPITASSEITPNADIPDAGRLEQILKVTKEMDLSAVTLDLDISHTQRSDLKVTLYNPAGKAVVVHDRDGGKQDDLKGKFELTGFEQTLSKGDWKLVVEDLEGEDVGKLNSAKLSVTGGPVKEVKKTDTPNVPLPDMGTYVHKFKVDENLDLQSVKLDVDMKHGAKSDLSIILQAPSGKYAVAFDEPEATGEDVKGTFDVSKFFPGEKTKGEWKVWFMDWEHKDDGVINKVGLSLVGVDKDPRRAEAKATVNADLKDNAPVTSEVNFTEKLTAAKLLLDLDIDHPAGGDVEISLTSPSGKSAVVRPQGTNSRDIKTTIDVSSFFPGEQVKGKWTLTATDKVTGYEGHFNTWGLRAEEGPKAPPGPIGDDLSMYSDKVPLSATKNADGTYSLADSTRGKGLETLNAKNGNGGSPSVPFVDNNNVWGETADPATNKAAIDAHYAAQNTYDFYRDILGRNSIDGNGEKLVSNVHIGQNYVNAFWDGEEMWYGDGDGVDASPLTSLDIGGHEITHGLTQRTAKLEYRNESGGINESMSDIMGAGVEWYASRKNQKVAFDYLVGEDVWTPGNGNNDALRYMDDPSKDDYSIDHYSKYPQQTEVHGSSGIMNNAFYLLSHGGTNKTSGQTVGTGIGMEKSLKIYGRALMFYMNPQTTFAGARTACIQAATDLYGANSTEVATVKASWAAVGLS